MTIKEVEERTGLPCSNVRYYEKEKLISPQRNLFYTFCLWHGKKCYNSPVCRYNGIDRPAAERDYEKESIPDAMGA